MYTRFVSTLTFCLLVGNFASAQKSSDKKTIKQLHKDIEYIASDELEGRRTGSEGERKAADYLISRYNKLKIKPFDNDYRIEFKFVNGKQIKKSLISIGTLTEIDKKDAFPLTFSASANVHGDVLIDVSEHGAIWLLPLYQNADEAADAHFDWEKRAFDKARDAAKKGATGVVFFDNYNAKFAPEFNKKSDYETIDIPVVFANYDVWKKTIDDRQDVHVNIDVELKKHERTANNVAAYIDNKAPYTVVLGAHYDHLGYGEDGNSLFAGKEKQIHNGADDNASGTAALLQLAGRIKSEKLNHYNYLFVNFSGEELGLFGSKAFAQHIGIDSAKIAYMLNMDMVGRLNDSTKGLTIGGIGTSPAWANIPSDAGKYFKVTIDSSGVGPSDHTSFYNKGIPVLFFFTGSHKDYHKPTDDADKINYNGMVSIINYVTNEVIVKMDGAPKPKFTATKQTTVGKARFKVTLGIMPDYSYQEQGVRVDGVSDGKPAAKAGVKAGDIIVQLGDTKIDGMQSYMEALGKQKEGASTKLSVKRDGKVIVLPITFK